MKISALADMLGQFGTCALFVGIVSDQRGKHWPRVLSGAGIGLLIVGAVLDMIVVLS